MLTEFSLEVVGEQEDLMSAEAVIGVRPGSLRIFTVRQGLLG